MAMAEPLLRILPAGSAREPAPHGQPLWRLGFRPFYLGAALVACLGVPAWIMVLLGTLRWQPAPQPMLWHAHEMLFGFAATVIVGFLLTAGKAWTGLQTPRGPALAALAGLWLAGRLSLLAVPLVSYMSFAVLDALFLPTVAVIFIRLLLRAGNRRNLPLAGLLALLSLANGVFHASVMGWIDLAPVSALHAGLGLVVLIECVMAGRVVPAFTANATPGLKQVPQPRLGPATLATSGLALAGWVFAPTQGVWGPLVAAAALAAATLHLSRQSQWHPRATFDRPILWILHAAYLWMPIGFALLALARMGWVNESAAVHAWGVGVTGGLIIGMITRTARGHTGRPLQVSRAETLAYSLVMAAAVLRVLVPTLVPQAWAWSIAAAAAAWSTAFFLYLVIYAPWLTRTRADGKDG